MPKIPDILQKKNTNNPTFFYYLETFTALPQHFFGSDVREKVFADHKCFHADLLRGILAGAHADLVSNELQI